ncbi:MAG TPA: hypothetical protein G4O13_06575 [Dehalococcoidia bacterium]|nr:hypothetical protein [Dehalococcoidia bacterium]
MSMAEELGKIEKPEAAKYAKGRKLLFVPLIFSPLELEEDLGKRIRKYWDEVEDHLSNLELKLGVVTKIFHELVPVGGDEGVRAIEDLNSESGHIIRNRVDKGAEIQPLEDADALTAFMDWSRCLAIGLQNQQVFTTVYEAYLEAHSGRNKSIAQRLDEVLKGDDIGILLMREGHQVQFPEDIEVFYVAPPALDELKRWIRGREGVAPPEKGTEAEEKAQAESSESTDKDSGEAAET